MLSKLLKYEIKATGRVFLPFFLALVVFAGITKFISSHSSQQWDNTPAILSMIIYILIMSGMFIMTFVVMLQRFYKNLLSDEGYLMFTLPVKPWKHILSKLLVSILWIAISVIVALISILIIAYEKGSITEIIKKFSIGVSQLNEQGVSVNLLTFEIIIIILLGLISWILLVYASIAIGHLFNKHKILASFGAFIVLNILSQMLTELSNLIPALAKFSIVVDSLDSFVRLQPVIELVFVYGIILSGLHCIAYFTITNFILSKKLNLE